MSQLDIVVVGHLSLDNYVVHRNRAAAFDVPAGNALGAAAGALCWEASVGIVSRAGRDYPTTVFAALEAGGVRLDGVRHLECPSIHFWILQEENNPSRIALAFNDVDFQLLSPTIKDIPDDYSQARGVHIAPMPIEHQKQFAMYFKERGAVVSLDPLPPGYHGDPDHHREILLETLSWVDVFMPGKPELDELFPNKPYTDSIRQCFELGVSIVVIRDGANGSFVYTAKNIREVKIPALPVEVLETSGAGDAYCGGFLAEYVRGSNVIESAFRGATSASFMLEQWGRLNQLEAHSEPKQRLHKMRQLFHQTARKAA